MAFDAMALWLQTLVTGKPSGFQSGSSMSKDSVFPHATDAYEICLMSVS